MYKPSWFRGEYLFSYDKTQAKQIVTIVKKSNLLFFAIALVIFAIMISLWNSQTTAYAHASTGSLLGENKSVSPLLENESNLFANSDKGYVQEIIPDKQLKNVDTKEAGKKQNITNQKYSSVSDAGTVQLVENQNKLVFNSADVNNQAGILALDVNTQESGEKIKSNKFAEKLYAMVGDTPIKDMVPFISGRDERVAAFLVGIAKKESSFGLASPSKDGKTCFNYWGYKGEGGRGTGMGYACFASAEEAIKTVGDRIEVLVNKDRNTPARMVDTWKCGVSCAGDPGAPGWTATVALYFNQIVNQNS
jgi:hypothetical protein